MIVPSIKLVHATHNYEVIKIYYGGFCAAIAQLGARQTEDLKVPGSIPGRGNFVFRFYFCSATSLKY